MSDSVATKAACYLVVVVLSLAGGEAMRRTAAFDDAFASAEEHLTMRDAGDTLPIEDEPRAPRLVSWLPIAGSGMISDVRRLHALAAYWRGDYHGAGGAEAISQPEGEPPDPALRLIAANAMFRVLAGPSVTADELMKGLDVVLKGYMSVLEVDADSRDAAYNYEFVSRLRNAAAAGRLNHLAAPASNIHGDQGAPPPETRPNEFNIIVPLRPEERQEQIEPQAGAVPQRKG